MAHVGLALAYASSPPARVAARCDRRWRSEKPGRRSTQALALDSGLGEAHSVLALLKFAHDFDWAGAEAEFKLALELSPGAPTPTTTTDGCAPRWGGYDEAIALVTARAGARSADAPGRCRRDAAPGRTTPGGVWRRASGASSSSPTTRGDDPPWVGRT